MIRNLRRLSFASLLAGALLLVPVAAPGKGERGGTLRVVSSGDLDHVDPALAYQTLSWQVEYATALKLFNYPDAKAPRGARLVPEAVSRYSVSKDGRVYAFTVKNGLRFSNGVPVTAKNFAYAIRRALARELASPAAPLVSDAEGVEIVGAVAVRHGTARRVQGVTARGNRLVIELERPGPRLLAILALPFFQAAPLSLPLSEITSVFGRDDLPSAGPYYVAARAPNKKLVLRRNPHYRGSRPRRPARIEFAFRVRPDDAYRLVEKGEADYPTVLPASAHEELARKYGVNRSRYRVNPSRCVFFLHLNSEHPLFKDNPQLRRAVAFAIDRAALAATREPYAFRPYDEYLPPTYPSYRDARLYPLEGPNLEEARRLARGNERGGRVPYYIPFGFGLNERRARMELVRRDLAQIGLTVEPVYGLRFQVGRPADWAMAPLGWCYYEGGDFVDLLTRPLFTSSTGTPERIQISAAARSKIERASRLAGAARDRAIAAIAAELARDEVPLVAWGLANVRELFSARVDPTSIVYHPVYESTDLAALAIRTR